jgi:hypothetical protein
MIHPNGTGALALVPFFLDKDIAPSIKVSRINFNCNYFSLQQSRPTNLPLVLPRSHFGTNYKVRNLIAFLIQLTASKKFQIHNSHAGIKRLFLGTKWSFLNAP